MDIICFTQITLSNYNFPNLNFADEESEFQRG